MVLDGAEADEEKIPDFLTGFAFGQQLEDFPLPVRKHLLGSSIRLSAAAKQVRYDFGDGGGEVGFTAADGGEGLQQLRIGVLFEEKAGRPGAKA